MRIGNRGMDQVLAAVADWRHYRAAMNMLRVYQDPPDAFLRYLLNRGGYPKIVSLNTPLGKLELTAYTQDDILTINEIFCREDYPVDPDDAVFVDFGSNIGVSAAYFLTRNPHAHAYLFEPLPQNVERLRANLVPFAGRYTLNEVGVGLVSGKARFGWEDTGRYGGINQPTGKYIEIDCVDSNEPLRTIIERHSEIDVLKIDIETLERPVTERIPADLLPHIKSLYVEYGFDENPLRRTHTMRHYGSITQFIRRA